MGKVKVEYNLRFAKQKFIGFNINIAIYFLQQKTLTTDRTIPFFLVPFVPSGSTPGVWVEVCVLALYNTLCYLIIFYYLPGAYIFLLCSHPVAADLLKPQLKLSFSFISNFSQPPPPTTTTTTQESLQISIAGLQQ